MKKNREFDAGHTCVFKILRIMRLSVFFMFLFIAQTWATSIYSQQTRLSINMNNVKVLDVLNEIEKKSEFYFFFTEKFVNVDRNVNINVKEVKIEEILQNLFQNSDIAYKLVDRQIILTKRTSENPLMIENERTLSGKVTDSSGGALPGVSVVVKGTTTGTITDANGNYTLLNVQGNATLIFSFIGMKKQEVTVGNKAAINVILVEETVGIEEVVAIGYGTQKKGTLTSSVSVVKSDEIVKSAVNDVTNALSGKAAGLVVRNFNAEPGGDASSIYIRGIGTTGDSNPLIVIDGIQDRDIRLIDMNDIESVTVLKDASAIAPFGSRGANGVILITTKRGSKGKPTINYNAYYGIQNPTILPKFSSSGVYARMVNEANSNIGMPEAFTANDIAKYDAALTPEYPNTDWVNELQTKNPIQSQQNLSVSGGSDNINYFISVGSFGQEGFFSNFKFKRRNIRANIDANVTKDIKVSFDLMGNTSDRNSAIGGSEYFFELLPRQFNTSPVKNSAGQYVYSGIETNAVAQMELGGYDKTNSNFFNGNMTAQYTPSQIKGLTIKMLVSFDKGYSYEKIWSTPFDQWRIVDRQNAIYSKQPATSQPSLQTNTKFSDNQQVEFQINYKRTFANRHNINAMFVANRTQWTNTDSSDKRINFSSAIIDQMFAGSPNGQYTYGSAFEGARIGYVGRLTYDFNSKYLVESNFRYDGSMNFAPGKRWGFFPSLALGWRISEEPFIKDNLGFINNLKLRGSWGQAGNDRVANYQYLAAYSFYNTPYSFGGKVVSTAQESRLPNPDITWETATLTDIGLETSLWKNLISLEADYFFKRTDHILRPTSKASNIIGINLPDENIGIVDSKGFEFVLGHKNNFGDFKYNVNTTFTYATNKAIELGEAATILNDPIRRQTGKPLNQYFGLIAEGLFTSDAEIADWAFQGNGIKPGDIKYKDINGPEGKPDGKIDNYDVTKIGYSSIPEIVYGLNLGASYKGIDITLNFQGATHSSYYFQDAGAHAFFNGGYIRTWQVENRWTQENNNPNARYPRLTPAPTANSLRTSSYWLRDGTYIRLRNAQLGYTFNKSLLTRFKIQDLRIYLSGQNLFTWVKDKLMYLDPESKNRKGNFYPEAKIYLVGLNVSF